VGKEAQATNVIGYSGRGHLGKVQNGKTGISILIPKQAAPARRKDGKANNPKKKGKGKTLRLTPPEGEKLDCNYSKGQKKFNRKKGTS